MFEEISKEAFDALTPAQQAYYIKQKKEHDKAELDKAIKASILPAVEEATKDLKETVEAQKTTITELQAEIKEVDGKREKAEAAMNRIQLGKKEEDAKTMKSEILKSLSSPDSEGRKQLEAHLKNKSNGVSFEIKIDAIKAAGVIGVPAGTTNVQWLTPISIPHEQVQARDIIPLYPTTQNAIKYVQFIKGQGKIGAVAPGTAKPQFDYTPVPKTANVVKIAGYVTTQEEFIEDIDGAAAWLAQELPWAYMDEETRQVFFGDPTGASSGGVPELPGLYSTVASPVNYNAGGVTPDSNDWDKLALMLTNTRRNLRPADAIWISPEDYLTLLINKSTGATQLYDYPIQATTGGQLYIGNIPIYFHTVFPPGTGLAGNFTRGVALFQKMAMTIRTSTEHDQNFTNNLITWLIEARVAMPVFFPTSFVKMDFNSTT